MIRWRNVPIVLSIAALAFRAPANGLAENAPLKRGRSANFINLTVSPPWDDMMAATWVLSAEDEKTIVAQHTLVRDIRVVEVEGDRQRFVGENGGGVTGLDGSILNAAARSPKGRLFIMAEHPRMVRIDGNRFCLYTLEDDRWTPNGPRFGAPKEGAFDFQHQGLHFLGDDRPVTVSYDPTKDGDKRIWRMKLRRLEGDRWATLPGHEYVYDLESHLRFIWRENDAWLIEIDKKMDRTKLTAKWIKGPRPEDIVGPFQLDAWPGGAHFFGFAAAPDGSLAAHGFVGDLEEIKPDSPGFLNVYRPAAEGTYRIEEAPLPPGGGHGIANIGFSPTGALHVVRHTDEKVTVYRLAESEWTEVASGAGSEISGTRIMDTKLLFRPSAEPIVTWENFLPAD